MKIFNKSLMLLMMPFALSVAACTEDPSLKISVVPVETILSPENGLDIELKPSASANVRFEWEPVSVSDGTVIQYEVAFTTSDGDLSAPLYITASNNKGKNPYLVLTHKEINKIAATVGIGAGEIGSMKWGVYSSKGVGAMLAADQRVMTVKRLSGFTDIPSKVYVYGSDVESDEGLAGAAQFKNMDEEGVFQIFTYLKAGTVYSIKDAPASAQNEYYIEGTTLKLGTTGFTVTEDAPYKIYLDYNSGIGTLSGISSVKWFHCNSNAANIELPYAGKGVWELASYTVTSADVPSNPSNPRYKIIMNYSDGATTVWGPLDAALDSAPTEAVGESYYFTKEYTTADGYTQFKPKWKRAQANTISWVGYTYDFALVLSASAQYTHKLVELSAPGL